MSGHRGVSIAYTYSGIPGHAYLSAHKLCSPGASIEWVSDMPLPRGSQPPSASALDELHEGAGREFPRLRCAMKNAAAGIAPARFDTGGAPLHHAALRPTGLD